MTKKLIIFVVSTLGAAICTVVGMVSEVSLRRDMGDFDGLPGLGRKEEKEE